MSRCPSCGGDLIAFGSAHRYCTFCGNTYGADASTKAQPVDNAQKKSFDTGANVFENNIGSVLEIQWSDSRYLHSGSGFVISADGYAITNTHVVTGENGASCGSVKVRIGENMTAEAEVCKLGDNQHGHGSGIDLALIKIKGAGSLRPARFANFDNVRNGEQIFVIGNSLGYGTCITSGIVSDKRRDVNGKPLLMTDCAINSGNSGGPMFNAAGDVIAVIVSGITGAEGMNFAIPADDVMEFINRCGLNINFRKSN